jgi:hypothetical protein
VETTVTRLSEQAARSSVNFLENNFIFRLLFQKTSNKMWLVVLVVAVLVLVGEMVARAVDMLWLHRKGLRRPSLLEKSMLMHEMADINISGAVVLRERIDEESLRACFNWQIQSGRTRASQAQSFVSNSTFRSHVCMSTEHVTDGRKLQDLSKRRSIMLSMPMPALFAQFWWCQHRRKSVLYLLRVVI